MERTFLLNKWTAKRVWIERRPTPRTIFFSFLFKEREWKDALNFSNLYQSQNFLEKMHSENKWPVTSFLFQFTKILFVFSTGITIMDSFEFVENFSPSFNFFWGILNPWNCLTPERQIVKNDIKLSRTPFNRETSLEKLSVSSWVLWWIINKS